MERKYLVRIGAELVPVSEEVYRAYYTYARRERTLVEKDIRNRVVSYDALDSDAGTGAEAIASVSPSPEEEVSAALLKEKLQKCLTRLSKQERELIHALFYCNEPLAAAARRLGVPRKTLEGQRDKILRKLRIYMDSPDRQV